ncbi:MAG: UDP-2,3-diacylglucosamine diphosphatase LpxI, partial [Pseudomonadota bacterium]
VPRLLAALQKGDDGALREVLAIFEEAGLTIKSASDIAPELLPDAGVLSSTAPTADHDQDAVRAANALAALGPLDIGQSIVVHRGQVLAVEGSFGTDWMLASLAHRPDGRGGVFYKAAKPGQDRRVDLPVIGVSTLQAAHAAGLDGVIIEAGGVMVLELEAVRRAADDLGLFFQVRAS